MPGGNKKHREDNRVRIRGYWTNVEEYRQNAKTENIQRLLPPEHCRGLERNLDGKKEQKWGEEEQRLSRLKLFLSTKEL